MLYCASARREEEGGERGALPADQPEPVEIELARCQHMLHVDLLKYDTYALYSMEVSIDVSRVGMHKGSQSLFAPSHKKINPHTTTALTAIHPSQPIHLTAKGGVLSYSCY